MPSPVLISDTELSGMVKTLYDELSVDTFPQSFALLAQLEKSGPGGPYNMQWGGEGVKYNAVTGIPGGGTFSPGGYLPYDHARTETKGTIDVQRFYVRRQIDGKTIAGTRSKAMAYRTIGEKVKREITAAYRRGMQIACHGTSEGTLAVITTFTSATSIDVISPYGITNAGQGGLLLAVGEYIALIDVSAANAVLGRAKITSLTHVGDTTTVALASPGISGGAAGDKLVMATVSDTSFQSSINGLPEITNRGNAYASLHSVSNVTYPDTAPIRMVAGTDTENATEITENDVWDLIRKVAGASGFDAQENSDEFFLVTTPGFQKKLAVSFYGQRNFSMAKNVVLRGGFKGVEICGVAVIADQWCPAGTAYLIHRPSLTWVDSVDFSPVQYEDSGTWRWMDGRDAWETSYKRYLNLGAPQRNAHGSISGYTTDTQRFTHIHAA